eukprot:TRINITY_DN7471_c0_g1_i3.p1 TRINITY_DN7471_c0_g1~~TRINITY_DN7471_c0_g1_i3.p1  ORF type:complete len:1203 (-),score=151.08 TRINITY_DN7471_c0_g1_i3:177-3785(-)
MDSLMNCIIGLINETVEPNCTHFKKWTPTPSLSAHSLHQDYDHLDEVLFHFLNQHHEATITQIVNFDEAGSSEGIETQDHPKSSFTTITYQTFNSLVNEFTSKISQLDVKGEIVALILPRSIEGLVSLMSLCRSHVAFCLMDPAAQSLMNFELLQNLQPKFIITTKALRTNVQEIFQNGTLALSELLNRLEFGTMLGHVFELWQTGFLKSEALDNRIEENVFSIVFTSGSERKPKQVKISRHAFANRISWGLEMESSIESKYRCFCPRSRFGFVDALYDHFAAFSFGASIVLANQDVVEDPARLCTLVQRWQVDRLLFVPASISILLDAASHDESISFQCLRMMYLSGEPFPLSTCRRLKSILPSDCKIINIYGSTEITADATAFVIDNARLFDTSVDSYPSIVPLGMPISRVSAQILGVCDYVMPEFVLGEICVSGACLSLGYRNSDSKGGFVTADSDISPSLPVAYRTGDMGYRHPEFGLVFVGRIDSQTNFGGVRVDFSQIEAAIMHADPSIKDCKVIDCPTELSQQDFHVATNVKKVQRLPSIMAACVLHDGNVNKAAIDTVFSTFMGKRSSSVNIVGFSSFPTTRTGKIDFKALRLAARQRLEYDALPPKHPIEEIERVVRRYSSDFTSAINLLSIAAYLNDFWIMISDLRQLTTCATWTADQILQTPYVRMLLDSHQAILGVDALVNVLTDIILNLVDSGKSDVKISDRFVSNSHLTSFGLQSIEIQRISVKIRHFLVSKSASRSFPATDFDLQEMTQVLLHQNVGDAAHHFRQMVDKGKTHAIDESSHATNSSSTHKFKRQKLMNVYPQWSVRRGNQRDIYVEKQIMQSLLERDTANVGLQLMGSVDLLKCIDASPLSVCASYEFDGRAHYESYIYVGSHAGLFVCIDSATCHPLWTQKLPDRIEASAVLARLGEKVFMVFVGCYDGCLYGMDWLSGEIKIRLPTKGIVKSAPFISTQTKSVYYGSYDANIYSYNYETSETRVILCGEKPILCDFCGSDDLDILLVCCHDHKIRGFFVSSGMIRWEHNIEGPMFSSPRMDAVHTRFYLGLVNPHAIECRDSSTGCRIFQVPCDGPVFSPPSLDYSHNPYVYCGSHDGFVRCFDAHSGEVIWKQKVSGAVANAPYIISTAKHGCLICAASMDGVVHILDALTGVIISQVKLDGHIFSAPVTDFNGHLWVGCRDNRIYKLAVCHEER